MKADSLNEGLPIKMAREDLKENDISSIKRKVGPTLEFFSHWKSTK